MRTFAVLPPAATSVKSFRPARHPDCEGSGTLAVRAAGDGDVVVSLREWASEIDVVLRGRDIEVAALAIAALGARNADRGARAVAGLKLSLDILGEPYQQVVRVEAGPIRIGLDRDDARRLSQVLLEAAERRPSKTYRHTKDHSPEAILGMIQERATEIGHLCGYCRSQGVGETSEYLLRTAERHAAEAAEFAASALSEASWRGPESAALRAPGLSAGVPGGICQPAADHAVSGTAKAPDLSQ